MIRRPPYTGGGAQTTLRCQIEGDQVIREQFLDNHQATPVTLRGGASDFRAVAFLAKKSCTKLR